MVVDVAQASADAARQEPTHATAADDALQKVMMLLPQFKRAIGTSGDARRRRETLIREVDRLCRQWGDDV